jgi:hypothetical protein
MKTTTTTATNGKQERTAQDYMQEFGKEQGAKWYCLGYSWTECLLREVLEKEDELFRLTKKCYQLGLLDSVVDADAFKRLESYPTRRKSLLRQIDHHAKHRTTVY